MKNRKWLFVVISIVFFVNIVYYILLNTAQIDEIAKDKISKILSEKIGGEIAIADFTFNDRHIKIVGLSIKKDDELSLVIEQIYIEYNLLKFIFSKFQNFKAIEHIKIYDPKINLVVVKNDKSPNKLPDISQYFQKLDIYNGNVKLKYVSSDISLSDSFVNLNLSVFNKKNSQIKLGCETESKAKLIADVLLKGNQIISAKIETKDFSPKISNITFADFFSTKLDAIVDYTEQNINVDGNLKENIMVISGKKIVADSCCFSGNSKQINLNFNNLFVKNEKINVSAILKNPFSENNQINGNILADKISLSNFVENVVGEISVIAKISGNYANPQIDFNVNSAQITAFEQKVVDMEISAKYTNKKLLVKLQQCFWEGNKIYGNGFYKDGFNFNLNADKLSIQRDNFCLLGDFSSTLKIANNLKIKIVSESVEFITKGVVFSDYEFNGNYENRHFDFQINHPKNSLHISGNGGIDNQQIFAKLSEFDLNSIIQNRQKLPKLTGNLELKNDENRFALDAKIRAFGEHYGELDGLFIAQMFADKKLDSTFVSIKSDNARYNYEPFEMNLTAKGTLDSLQTTEVSLNDLHHFEGWISRKKGIKYGFKIYESNIKLKEFAKYFADYYTANKLHGSVDLDILYDNFGEGYFSGKIGVDNFKYNNVGKISARLFLDGNNREIAVSDCSFISEDGLLLNVDGTVKLQPNLELEITGKSKSTQLENIFLDNYISGDLTGEFLLMIKNKQPLLKLDYHGKKIKFNDFKIDSLRVDVTQSLEKLIIDNIYAKTKKQISLTVDGEMGYNFITKKHYPDSNKIKINYSGDLFKLISKQSNYFTTGSSNCKLEMQLGVKENELSFENGHFQLVNGTLQTPQNKIEDTKIYFQIDDDTLKIDEFNFKMGDGKFYLKNVFDGSKTNFKFGLLDIGRILVRTNKKGLLLHIPKYMPENSFANVVISGRTSKYLNIYGPFEGIHIEGDLTFSNGAVIYPPNTENLLKLFNVTQEIKKYKSRIILPFTFDLMLHSDENIHYVTYPTNIQIAKNGFLRIKYDGENFSVPSAHFEAENGVVDIFGTQMTLNEMLVNINQLEGGANIAGTFSKKIIDGSVITLKVFNQRDIGLNFEFSSDDVNDKITDILAKLRYNRKMEDISDEQKSSMMQEEFVQIAGLGLESAIISSLLSPIENFVRKLFRLDYFRLQTDLMQNIFTNYSEFNLNSEVDESSMEQFDRFSSDFLLNNLRVNMGKYVSNKFYLEYQSRFEKSVEVFVDTEMGIYHDFILRYDLFNGFKLSYKYKILPFDEDEIQEIKIEKSFRF